MASSHSSRLRFLDTSGVELDAPLEWSRGLVEIDCAPDQWRWITLTRNGAPMPLFVKEVAGQVRVLADWPLSGCGNFRLTLASVADGWVEERLCTVEPRKLSTAAVEQLIDDLQQRLPASIAISLKRAGALAGIELVSPLETTLAEELQRLTRTVRGTTSRPGLVEVLRLLAERPYQVLRAREEWTDREHARRIDVTRLAQAFTRPGNLGQDIRPVLVPERPVTQSVDTYENRLVKSFYTQVNVRLRLLHQAMVRRGNEALAAEASSLLSALTLARRNARFLDQVGELTEPPARVTMVLLKRPEYRAAFEEFLEFRRRALVHLSEPQTDSPLEDLPFLYQTWGVLEVVNVLLKLAVDFGYDVRRERLTSRRSGELWIDVLRDGQPAVVLTHPRAERTVKLIPQRSYSPTGQGLHSISFRQIPDIAIEVAEHDHTSVYIFDPKYKLDSEQLDGEAPLARPKKTDIDAMHSYRDSIRSADGHHVVRYAAILYPGPTITYTPGLGALSARPQEPQPLEELVRAVLVSALTSDVEQATHESFSAAEPR